MLFIWMMTDLSSSGNDNPYKIVMKQYKMQLILPIGYKMQINFRYCFFNLFYYHVKTTKKHEGVHNCRPSPEKQVFVNRLLLIKPDHQSYLKVDGHRSSEA